MDPATISAVGTLASGVGSLLGGSNSMHPRDANRAAMVGRFEAAKEFGLHPLTVAGGSAGYQPASRPNFGSNLRDLGNTLSEVAADKAAKKTAGEQQKKADELLEAQLMEMRSRTGLNLANTKRVLGGPGQPPDPFKMETHNALIEVMLENGDIIRVPNPAVYEIGPSELATGRILLEGGRVIERASNGNWTIKEAGSSRGGPTIRPPVGSRRRGRK